MAERRLSGLDALRGIAALCVLVFHLTGYGVAALFPSGNVAVDFFFMLSGYVMARTYEARLAEGLSPSAFLIKRYRRLWPVAAIGMVIALPVLGTYTPGLQVVLAVAGLLLIPVASRGYLFPGNVAAWSSGGR